MNAFLYKYKNEVLVPPLEMVDDIVAAVKCGKQAVQTNSAINTFIKLKKLELSVAKCSRLHVGKNKCDPCAKLMVGQEPIKESYKEKYLGDYVTHHANPKATIEDRKKKGNGILSEMWAILGDIPLGERRFEMGMTLRQAWFINGTLYNSEVWCSFSNADIEVLNVLHRKIILLITGAHSKTPSELLYLETGALTISHVIAVRRHLYLEKTYSWARGQQSCQESL